MAIGRGEQDGEHRDHALETRSGGVTLVVTPRYQKTVWYSASEYIHDGGHEGPYKDVIIEHLIASSAARGKRE